MAWAGGDGDLDIATAEDLSNDVSVLLNSGDGTLDSAVNYNEFGACPGV